MSLSVNVGNQQSGVQMDGVLVSPQNQILSNGVTATNTTTPQTIITIPAGKVWTGTISLGCTNSAAAGASGTAAISVSGGGTSVPSQGTNLLKVHCSTVGTTAGLASQNNGVPEVTVAALSGTVTLVVTNSTGTTFTSDASAVGMTL